MASIMASKISGSGRYGDICEKMERGDWEERREAIARLEELSEALKQFEGEGEEVEAERDRLEERTDEAESHVDKLNEKLERLESIRRK